MSTLKCEYFFNNFIENCDFEIGALDELVKNKQVMVYKHGGNWECMDHERDVDHLNNLWNTNKAFWKKWN